MHGLITSTASGAIFTRTGASIAAHYMDLNNTSGRALIGVEGSAAGGLLTGSTAYAMVIDTGTTNKPIQFGVNDTLALTITSSGLTVPGTLGVTGAITGAAISGTTLTGTSVLTTALIKEGT